MIFWAMILIIINRLSFLMDVSGGEVSMRCNKYFSILILIFDNVVNFCYFLFWLAEVLNGR